jgi:hypothetical protein
MPSVLKISLISGSALLSLIALSHPFSRSADRQTIDNPSQNSRVTLNPSDFYVSPFGSDQNSGSLEQPFKTAQKCADLIQPGKTCYLRAGTYRETIRPVQSGTPSAPITFTAYQNEAVMISGAEPIEGWEPFRNSIFRAKAILPSDGYRDTEFLANQVFAKSEMMNEARWPNLSSDLMHPTLVGGAVKSRGGTAATVENSTIPNVPEGWAGATVWTNEWYVSRTGRITGGTKGVLTAEMSAPWERGGFWFYLVGKLSLLDAPKEWFYDGQRHLLYLWIPGGKQPSQVEVKQRNFAFDLSGRSYVTLRSLNLFASTVTSSSDSQGLLLDGLRAKYVSHHVTLPPLPKDKQAPGTDNGLIVASHAQDTGIQLRGKGNSFRNSVLSWSSGNGVLLEGTGHQVIHNRIENTNYGVSYAAPIRINGTGHKIIHNTITATGRDAINIDWHTAGTDARFIEIAYNDISNFGLLSTDLGAVYICCTVNLEGGLIHHNWIHDAKAFSPFWGTRGIYLDLNSFNSTIHHNVLWNITGGKDSFYIAVGSKTGYNKLFNNTVLGPISTDASVEARNNIFSDSPRLNVGQQSNNLLLGTNPQLTSQSGLFTLKRGSPAIDSGVKIPGITDGFSGSAPDLGAYEQGVAPWMAGAMPINSSAR